MPWIRLDDQFPDHPKVVEAGPLASWLYVCGIGYCNRLLTDGFIPSGQVRKLADVDNAGDLVKCLVAVGLWDEAEGGYQVHDFLDYQPSAEQVKAERSMNKVRKDLYADPFLTKQVKERDGDRCRYCYKYVRWTDRKSALGGTFDHVIPNGGNSLDNLVVACRGCNSGKGRRTPEQANMTLRPPFSGGTSSELVPDGKELDTTQTESIHPYPTRTRTHPVPNPEPIPAQRVDGVPAPKRADALHPLPSVESLTEQLRPWAQSKGVTDILADEVERFHTHCLTKIDPETGYLPNSKKFLYINYAAGCQKWITNPNFPHTPRGVSPIPLRKSNEAAKWDNSLSVLQNVGGNRGNTHVPDQHGEDGGRFFRRIERG